MLHLKDLSIKQVLCLQHIRGGLQVLHLMNLGVNRIQGWPVPFTKKSKIPDELNPSGFEDLKQREGSIRNQRTPNKKRQPRLPLLEPGHSLTWKHYTTSALTGRGAPSLLWVAGGVEVLARWAV